MHQPSNGIIVILIAAIHVYDVGTVSKICARLFDDSIHMVQWQPLSHDISCRYEYHIGIMDFLKFLPCFQHFCVDHAAMEPCSVRVCPF